MSYTSNDLALQKIMVKEDKANKESKEDKANKESKEDKANKESKEDKANKESKEEKFVRTYVDSQVLKFKLKEKVVSVCKTVKLNNKKYIVGKTNSDTKKSIMFVCDYEFKDVAGYLTWNRQTHSDYIAHTLPIRQVLYMHNYVLKRYDLNTKGIDSVDHINRITWDNRKENLRVTSQKHQNFNQKKKKRSVELPENCGIDPNDIPKNVWYVKPTGNYGDYFEINIKNLPDGNDFRKKTTKSKSVSLKCKLEEAKHYIKELQKKFPGIVEERRINASYSDEAIGLIKSYNKIIELSGFDCWEDNIIKVPKIKDFLESDNSLSETEKEVLKTIITTTSGKKRTKDTLPENCSVTKDQMPKYCYYNPERNNRGDSFVIDRHPKLLEEGKRLWKTTESKKFTTEEKFKLLKEKLIELESK